MFDPVSTKLITNLNSFTEARFVGGCVRDHIIGSPYADVDIAVKAIPEVIIRHLGKLDYKVIPTGFSYGTVTVCTAGKEYQITTLRSDIKTFGRHAEIEFTDSWFEDAKRRDFTFNAMYMDQSGTLYDYFNGRADLEARCVKFIGNPKHRIKEDYLRILRYFRFCSYYGASNIDYASLEACKFYKNKIWSLSGERITAELLKILTGNYVYDALSMMLKASVLKSLFGRNCSLSNIKLTNNGVINLAILITLTLQRDLSTIHQFFTKLKLPNRIKTVIKKLIFSPGLSQRDSETTHKEFILDFGALFYQQKIMYLNALGGEIVPINNVNIPEFDISGNDLLALGYKGPEIGLKLRELQREWLDSNFQKTKDELLKYILHPPF